MTKIKQSVLSFFNEQKESIERMMIDNEEIIRVVNILLKARDDERKILTIGNGGSASTSSHFVSDLLKTAIIKDKKRFSAISLVDNIPVMLAWANDTSYEDIFVEQLKNFVSKGDVVIAFSGSGSSKNVVKAIQYARKKGAFCIGITGMSGGRFPRVCNLCLRVPSDDMLTIESLHLTLCHCFVTAIRNTGKPVFKYE